MASVKLYGTVALALAILVLVLSAGNIASLSSSGSSSAYTIKPQSVGFQYNSIFPDSINGHIIPPTPGVLNATLGGPSRCNLVMTEVNTSYVNSFTYSVSFKAPCNMQIREAVIHYSGLGSLTYLGCKVSIDNESFVPCVGQTIPLGSLVTFENSVQASSNYKNGEILFFLSNQEIVIN